ncbi:MAG: Glu/Leu/Phe/Val dehydrogenase dimerization domain-containing protein [Nannocystaceae bacterium]
MTVVADGPAPERILELTAPDGSLRGLIVIDSTVRGPAFGGIRRCGYLDAAALRADALALAAAMRDKCAIAQLPAGGAKTVLWDRFAGEPWAQRSTPSSGAPSTRCGPLRAAPTSAPVRPSWTSSARTRGTAIPRATALARPRPRVCSQRCARCGSRWATTTPAGARVVVQGLGDVGLRVATALVQQGARVLGQDIGVLPWRARAAGVECIPAALETPCDVLVPCARGQGAARSQRCDGAVPRRLRLGQQHARG